jgi:hypothetical protein
MLVDPVEAKDLLVAVAAGAVVVLAGAAYALLFALARVHGRPGLMPFAYLAYALLVAAVAALAQAAHFSGLWNVVALLMLGGYLLAPHGVWRLCVGTHDAPAPRPDEVARRQTGEEGMRVPVAARSDGRLTSGDSRRN